MASNELFQSNTVVMTVRGREKIVSHAPGDNAATNSAHTMDIAAAAVITTDDDIVKKLAEEDARRIWRAQHPIMVPSLKEFNVDDLYEKEPVGEVL